MKSQEAEKREDYRLKSSKCAWSCPILRDSGLPGQDEDWKWPVCWTSWIRPSFHLRTLHSRPLWFWTTQELMRWRRGRRVKKMGPWNTLKTNWCPQTMAFQGVTVGILKVTTVKSLDDWNTGKQICTLVPISWRKNIFGCHYRIIRAEELVSPGRSHLFTCIAWYLCVAITFCEQ